MTTKNLTFSIPIDLSDELHTFVKKRCMSKFVTEAIRIKLQREKLSLAEECRMANQDAGQLEAAKDWESTLLDGANEW